MNPRLVKGNGREDAEIVIVTDYPSKEEATSGRAGQGFVGRVMGNYLRDNHWSLDRCYVTNYIKREFHLPKAKNLQEKAVKEALGYDPALPYAQILGTEIADIKPNVIISAGEIATQFLTGRKGVYKLRGSILPVSDIARIDSLRSSDIPSHTRVIPVIHPRDDLKEKHSSYTSLDYARAIKYRTRKDQIRDDSLVWICWTLKALTNWWYDRGQYGKFLTFDIETFNTFITCISFCADGKEALSIPLIDRRMLNIDRAFILRFISKILRDKIKKVNQNIDYDDYMLRQWGFEVSNIDGDTMLLGHCIYPELPKGLDFYTSIYTEIPYYKDDGRDFNPKDGWDTLYIYNAKDSLVDWKIYEAQEQDARELGVWSFYREKVWPLFNIYKKHDDRGIMTDPVEQNCLLSKYTDMLQERHAKLQRLVGKEINFNAPAKVAEVVYGQLGYPEQFKTDRETGKRSLTTGEETLEELILNYSKGPECDEILWNLIWCRKLFKVRKLVLTPFHLDGRMRTNSKLTGTKSGRTSNSQTIDRIWFRNDKNHQLYKKNKKLGVITSAKLGLSFQTIGKHGFTISEEDDDDGEFSSYEIQGELVGKDIRKMYIPTPGYTFVEGDGGQAEARVVAMIAEDYDALDEMERKDFRRNRFRVKDDIHTKTAMLVLIKAFEDITEEDRQDFGKKPQHAGNYDMGAARLALMAHIGIDYAQTVLTRFHSNRPKIRENFHFGVRSVVSNSRILSTPHGRLRQFLGKITSDTFKEAYSYVPQAVVTDHTKFDTITPLMLKWDEPEVYFLAESHDSAFFEVRNDCVDEFCEDFRAFGETAILFNQGTFIRERPLVIPMELKNSTTNWYEMKERKAA